MEILILQHQRERRHALGTARIAVLGLRKVRLQIAWPNVNHRFVGGFGDLKGAGLLFPRPGARELAEVPPEERPRRLVVLDGTWDHAKSLYRDNPWLQKLPTYKLSPAQPSRYRIRREPNAQAVSTIEAIVQALMIVEPETRGVERLLEVFERMIDQQLGYIQRYGATGENRRFKFPRQRVRRPVLPRCQPLPES